MLNPQQQSALKQIASASVASERQTGVPAALSAAQAILESGWLMHNPGNNCFGLKWWNSAPASQLLHTTEWFTPAEAQAFILRGGGRTAVLAQPLQINGNRRLYNVQDLFAAFPTLADCFTAHAKLLTHGVYVGPLTTYQASGKTSADLKSYIDGIAVHYATAPNYATEIYGLATMASVQAEIAAARLG